MRLYAKNQERLVPLHPVLRRMLEDRKNELGLSWNPELHIISYIRDTLTTYFKRAMKNAGIDKPGAVHILRHTAITKVLESTSNIRIAQEFAGHKEISTTQIYTHVLKDEIEDAVNQAF